MSDHDTKPAADTPEERLEACGRERDEYLEGWKRAKADLINYRKEEAERIAHATRAGYERILKELITVLDSFDLGLGSLADENPAKKGMYLIKTQLEDSLRRHGLERIPVEPGEPFDPAKHEAVAEMESPLPEGAITEEIERGYSFHGKVIRASRVRIAKGHS